MSEVYLMHREITLKGEKVEHLISLVPNDTIPSIISRIKPKSGDEIVIKVLDENIEPNVSAKKLIDEIQLSYDEYDKMKILTGAPDFGFIDPVSGVKDDLPF